MGTWIDTAVLVVVVVLGLAVLYKGLKEPIDMVGRLIASGFKAIFSNKKEKYDEIVYG